MVAKTVDSIVSDVNQGNTLGYITYVWLGKGSKTSKYLKS